MATRTSVVTTTPATVVAELDTVGNLESVTVLAPVVGKKLQTVESSSSVLDDLVKTVVKARGAFTSAVASATIQAIGHFLVHGDTSYLDKLHRTFTKGTLGGRQFVLYCEKFGGVELLGKTSTKPERFAKCDETHALIDLSDDRISKTIAYMKGLPTDWQATKANKPEVPSFDLEGEITKILERAKKSIPDSNDQKVLLTMLQQTVSKYHQDVISKK